MKKFRLVLYILLPVVIVCFFSGCHAHHPLEVTVDRKELSGKVIDILIPMNPDYVQDNDNLYIAKEVLDLDEEALKKSEIYSYNDDGYVSLLVHYNGLCDHRRVKNNEQTEIIEYYFSWYKEYKAFCEEYKKFKIAVLDYNGDVLSVSEEYDFYPKKNVYLEEMEFDISGNKVSAEYTYERNGWLVLFEFIMLISAQTMPFWAGVAFLIAVVLKFRNKSDFPQLCHVFVFAGLNIPFVVYLLLRVDYILKGGGSFWNEVKDYFTLFYSTVFYVIYLLIPIILLIAVTIWVIIKKKMKKDG